MFFPFNLLVAGILSLINLLITFSLRLSRSYKNSFRVYSVLINSSFLLFFMGFNLFLILTSSNQGINIYLNGLIIFYILLFVPLSFLLIYLFKKFIMEADIQPIFLKYLLLFIVVILVIVFLYLAYALFILTFYGFAP